jgi:hypothetical protein
MKNKWVLGFDPFVDWIEGEEDISKNIGEGKAMPQGPECIFNGKHIPTFCCCSENGSIMGQLLKEMFSVINSLGIYDHTGTGLNPFLLLVGHRSHFELNFLNYINAVDTKW